MVKVNLKIWNSVLSAKLFKYRKRKLKNVEISFVSEIKCTGLFDIQCRQHILFF